MHKPPNFTANKSLYTNDPDFTRALQHDFDGVAFEDVDLTVAHGFGVGKPLELNLAGTALYVGQNAYDNKFVVSSSLTVGTALLTLNEPQGNPIELSKGMAYDFGQPFERVFIHNAAQSGTMLRLFATLDARITPFATELQLAGSVATGLTDFADVTILTTATTQVLAVNASRKSSVVTNLQANGTVIRVGTSSAGAARGPEVPIGGSYVHESQAALYVYNPSAGSIAVGVAEETI